ncbi:metalloregulator ArsR/SmtB family transcription factor [Desulfosporosinus sp. OT]|uniref:ArsR/SmtB family transcription factor n=1 Tax=Desulfosporosinus sp. OT TaxID=913865 RepID=UPI00058C78E9|nr:metalloregulator ArsR/SmtB family transcription factor [Desulfosporosinus sp. OT]
MSLCKALSNPNRLELYFQIAKMNESSFPTDSECFVTDIISSLNIGAPTISHHIKELVNADLIRTEKKGKFLICKVNEELIEEVSKSLKQQ